MAARTRRRGLAALAATALAPALLPVLGTTPAAATTRVEAEVVADGLDNPRGLAFGPDGSLYVTEAGRGGESPCQEGPEGDAVCLGGTGGVTRVDLGDGSQERVVEGLPSLAAEGGAQAVGPSDVAVTDDGRLLVTVGLGADPALREELGEDGATLGTLVAVDLGSGAVEVVADLAAFEAAEDPDGGEPDSNPNALLLRDDEVLVADAGGNSVVAVDAQGEVSTVAVLPTREVDAPPGIPGLPPRLPMQAVPTSLAEGLGGHVLVGELTGFPFPRGGALVHRLDPEAARPVQPQQFAGGLTNIIDVAQRDDDTFVLEIATNSLLSGEDAVGALVRLRPDGSAQRVGQDVLRFPGGMTVGPDGALYVTNLGVAPGEGQVLRIDPSLAGDPAIQEACPPDDTAFPPFTDIAASVHEEAIACLWWWEVVRGTGAGLFSPEGSLTRGQTASMLVRAAGRVADLPTGAPDAFTDDEGSPHEDAIDLLASAGVMRGTAPGRAEPDRAVTRAQLVALMVRAADLFLDEPLPAGPDAFPDDDGVHEDVINRAAAAGWVAGDAAGRFHPDRVVTRAQASSVLARALSTLVEEGVVTLPDPVAPD